MDSFDLLPPSSPDAAAPPAAPYPYWIGVGAGQVPQPPTRPHWLLRVLIWFAVLLVVAAAVSVLIVIGLAVQAGSSVRLMPEVEHPPWWLELGADVFMFPALFAATIPIVRYVDHRPVVSLGLGFNSRWLKDLAMGWGTGLLLMSIVIGILVACGAYRIDGVSETLAASIPWAVGIGVMFLGVALFEEFSCRGYLLQVLVSAMPVPIAVLITCFCFTIPHIFNSGELIHPIGLAEVFAAGVLLAVPVLRTRSLWMAVGIHGAWDWAQNFMYSVPDSGVVLPGGLIHTTASGPAWLTGATVGPEGSVVAILVTLAAAVVLARAPWVRADPEAAALWDRYVQPQPERSHSGPAAAAH